jgi:hypothetical protein
MTFFVKAQDGKLLVGGFTTDADNPGAIIMIKREVNVDEAINALKVLGYETTPGVVRPSTRVKIAGERLVLDDDYLSFHKKNLNSHRKIVSQLAWLSSQDWFNNDPAMILRFVEAACELCKLDYLGGTR